ncbi:MAG: TrkA family potassium uptake protein [Arcobacteraceae bacterium]|nr:TrkA family potassium uptake protein [Arcobacteraceae bacterium]
MRNKILIYSFSSLAVQVAKVLNEKDYHIVIIEEDEDLINKAKLLGYEVKNTSLLDDENIIGIGINNDDIKAFFCLGDDKNTNLFITLSVRNINKNIKIISVSSTKEGNKTMLLAGANKIINPYEIGALRIFRLLHKPLILDVLDNILFSKSDIEVAEITIKKGSIFDGIYLRDLKIINREDIIILGIQDKEISDKFIFFSTGINHKIDADDTLVVLGQSENLKRFKKEIHHII